MKIWGLFNLRTFLALIISQIAAFITVQFQLKFHLDLLLFSLCVVFPLHFSLQAAFKRRDRALEYFSVFKAGVLALNNSFRISEDLSPEKRTEVRNILNTLGNQLSHQLEHRIISYGPMKEAVDKIVEFIEKNRESLSNRNVMRMIRYTRDITESSVYLISLIRHRTMIGLRVYAITFILVFPMAQAPILYNRLGDLISTWAFYLILAIGSLILVTLNNFQEMIEYPFDKKGMDNIRLQDFSLEI